MKINNNINRNSKTFRQYLPKVEEKRAIVKLQRCIDIFCFKLTQAVKSRNMIAKTKAIRFFFWAS